MNPTSISSKIHVEFNNFKQINNYNDSEICNKIINKIFNSIRNSYSQIKTKINTKELFVLRTTIKFLYFPLKAY